MMICWPDPDATCLEGGCVHCEAGEDVPEPVVAAWASQAGQVRNRCGGRTQDALQALNRRAPA